MSDSLQRELEDICLRILRNREEDTAGLLDATRQLYEKIVVLHHNKQQTPKSDSPPVESPNTSRDLSGSVRTVPIPEGPPPVNKPEVNADVPKEAPVKAAQTESKPPQPADKVDPVEQKKEPVKPKSQDAPKPNPAPKPKVKQTPAPNLSSAPLASLKVGLNDRIAFVKKLFHNRDDDFNRVLSQINGFDNYEEAESFLHNLVVPEYGWDMDDEFTKRFINLVRMRFGLDEIPEE